MAVYQEGIEEGVKNAVTGAAFGIFTIVLLHFALRTCWLPEELCQIPGRYPDKFSAVQRVFSFNMKSLCAGIISLVVLLLMWVLNGNPLVHLWIKESLACIMLFLAGIVFSKLIYMEESPLHTSLQIESMRGLDYGSGMAYNFFYGYLRLVLPEGGTQGAKGIKRRIRTFINHHHISGSAFPVKKLFILIPQNLYTPTDLQEVSTDWPYDSEYWMEAAVSLESQEIDRAGVKQRTYKNSVYKIWNRDIKDARPVYVVAEGATPLKTFNEVIQMNARMSRVFKDHQHDIVLAFYKTLRDLIREDDDCRDVCEIIYYADTEGDRKVNVARIILERIQQLTGRDAQQCSS